MSKPFAQCSLPDLALEIPLALRACSALDAATIALLLPRLADVQATEAALQHRPLVRGASGLGRAHSPRAPPPYRRTAHARHVRATLFAPLCGGRRPAPAAPAIRRLHATRFGQLHARVFGQGV